nr:T9SS type A sorting domain-containing protein [uncultured Flavobacterium sp.]
MPNDEYMLIARVTNYSPETYPGLFTDTATQQDWQNKTGFISIHTTTDFTPIVIHSLFFTQGNHTLQTNYQFFKGTDNNIYFYLHNEIGKVSTTGELAYKQTLDIYYINSLTYYDGFLYGLENHFRDVPTQGDIVYGKLLKINASTGLITNSAAISDPTAALIDYLGIAADATGVFVFGTVSYVQPVTGYEPNTTFYYTPGAFQPFQGVNNYVPSIQLINAGFLTKYNLNNFEEVLWSTYIGGAGMVHVLNNNVPRNSLKLINNDLYIAYFGSHLTNISTPGAYIENNDSPFSKMFLMRFNSNGERLMGTYLHPENNYFSSWELDTNTYQSHILVPCFAEGVTETNQIVLSTRLSTSTPPTENLSANAPYTTLGTKNVMIQQFTPQGQRVYGIIASNNGDMGRYHSVITEPQALKVFTWEFSPNASANYLTQSDLILNYRNQAVFSVAEYNKTPLNNQTFENNSFSIYPNPTSDILFINHSENARIEQIEIYDVNGRLVLQPVVSDVSNAQINVNQLANGMYVLKIKTANQVQNFKFIKK